MSSRRAATGGGPLGNTSARTGGSAEPGGRHLSRRASAGHPVLKGIAALLSLVLVAGVVFGVVQVMRLQGNFDTEPLNLGSGDAPVEQVDANTDPMQILVLGTDNRDGQNSNNSDVMMLVNLSADRSNVTVVSFPRDLLVPLPQCEDPASGVVYDAMDLGQLNGALGNGGPGCTVAAINELTGLTIDHFMMADFDAVKELSNTLGGVEVCVNQPVNDPLSGLDLPAGVSTVQGEQALAFLRTRHGFGNGGDEGRIRAQQSFLASMVRKVKDEGTLNNLPKLYSMAETVTKNLTVDEGLAQIPDLVSLATRLKDVDLGKVAFVTAPVVPWELDPNRLVLDEEKAQPLFDALVSDQGVTAEPTAPGTTGTPTDASTDAATGMPVTEEPTVPVVDPATVPVTLVNASGASGRDKAVAEVLLSKGFVQALAGGTASTQSPATQIFYGYGYEEMALEVARTLNIPDVQVVLSAAYTGVSVEIGADFASGSAMKDLGDVGDLSGQTAAQVTCQSAFGN
ncbi:MULTISPECIES: LCP family protein [unclassified Arthrobacter]|uniref:LCP family protein n=1 Tax=unclassified Arthrobacter TaxID=235627 RepID=UPI001D148292|nr:MULTISPECIES: LCP family protein [unclassified Arthrobacter]MCC3274824.1 LCP family protein [Arthrobacter sp. zg-Y20]MCC3279206.1 LCP family protein [Arthrobacter sp. zg-Y40]MCC9177582.1 LCP family protein [Arthrobacter sp. zg-Y750]MDK1314980.1 LCP family protein [Arthrobacter sp. zg.Y20]MDK1327842.1 LCP family protein [Arthrobacter sp. zg-Y1143]